MNLKRLFRLAAFSGLVAAAVAAARFLTRDKDPLPVPAGGPSDPWPPLRSAEPSTSSKAGTGAATITPAADTSPTVETDAESATLATVPDAEETDAASGAEDATESAEEPAADEQTDGTVEDDGRDPSDEEEEGEPEAADDDAAAEASRTTATARRRRREPLRAPWMPPNDDGSCPDGFPLKANDHSKIFHAPGQMSYDRTVPERCYAEADAAVADGYRAAKR